MEERTPSAYPPGSVDPVAPSGDEVPSSEVLCTLYYRYKQEDVMAPKTLPLSPSSSVSIEQAIVEQLIAGPGADPYGLSATIHPDTRVLAVTQSHGFLSITLSQEFLKIPGDTSPWQDVEGTYDADALMNRRMAVYSIINSITELGVHSRILIQVDADGTGASERIKRKQAGFSTQMEQPIEPLERDTSLIYTAERSLRIALDALKERNWEQLDAMIAVRDVDGSRRPSQEEMSERLGARLSLVEYTIPASLGGMTVMQDGSQATVSLTECVFKNAQGSTVRYENIPLRLVRDKDIWRVAYASLEAMLPTESL